MLTDSNVDALKRAVEPLEKFIWDNEYCFVTNFSKLSGAELIQVRFGSRDIEFVYMLREGQHVVDGIDWVVFMDWVKQLNKEML
jgi:hypothetical protein